MTERITKHKILDDLELNIVPLLGNNHTLYGNEGKASLLLFSLTILEKYESMKKTDNLAWYCNIGHCSECRVTVNGKRNQRACLTPLVQDMVIEQQFEIPYVVKEGSPYV